MIFNKKLIFSESMSKEEKIDPKKIEAASKILSFYRTYSTRKKYLKFRSSCPVFKKLIERKHLINELVKTEKSFVSDLKIIHDVYMEPLLKLSEKRSTTLLSKEDINTIFNIHVIKQMITLHEQLFSQLTEEVKGWPLKCDIMTVMNNTAPYLKLWSPYISNYHRSEEKLQSEMKKKPKLSKFLRKQREENKIKLGLDGYLIMPVQRIPRYVLFFKSIIKNTDPKSEDYGNFTVSLKLLTQITEHVNIERKRSRVQDGTKLSKNFHFFTEVMVPHRKFQMMINKVKIYASNSKSNGEVKTSGTFAAQLLSDMFIFYDAEKKEIYGTIYFGFAKLLDRNEKEFIIKFKDILYVIQFDDPLEKQKCVNEMRKLIKEKKKQMTKRGIKNPQNLIVRRARTIHEIVMTNREMRKREEKVNNVYEKLQKILVEIEKMGPSQKDTAERNKKVVEKKNAPKKKNPFSLKNIFRKKGSNKSFKKKMSIEDYEREKDDTEEELKKAYKRKKECEEYLSELKETLTMAHSMIQFCMGDERFNIMFPPPIFEEDLKKRDKKGKLGSFERLLLPVCKNETDALDVEYYLKKAIDDSTINMDKNFEEDFLAIENQKFKYSGNGSKVNKKK